MVLHSAAICGLVVIGCIAAAVTMVTPGVYLAYFWGFILVLVLILPAFAFVSLVPEVKKTLGASEKFPRGRAFLASCLGAMTALMIPILALGLLYAARWFMEMAKISY
jgi:hypothetical protein